MNVACKSAQLTGRLATTSDEIVASVEASIESAQQHEQPYPYWILSNCLPEAAVRDVLALPFKAPALEGVSGRRELHNATRTYFDQNNNREFPVCGAICEAFGSPRLVNYISNFFSLNLAGSYLRAEFAQDSNGFWLEPHTDLGVKLFTMLLYLSTDPGHDVLGTDIYDADKKHVGRSPFSSNAAMVFIPSNNTFHGFEKRAIPGVRKSLIINYVTDEWKAREQLATPERPIA